MMELSVASRSSMPISPNVDDSENSNPQQGSISNGVSYDDRSTPMEKSFPTVSVDAVPEFGAASQTTGNAPHKGHALPSTRRSGRVLMKIPPTSKDSRKLFVGGLPMDVTSHEFLTFFLQFGNVLDSVVMFDRETRKPRGFGFVTFDDPEVCCRLLRMGQMDTLDEEKESEGASPHSSGRLEMRGKLIEVKAAQPKASPVTKVPLFTAPLPQMHKTQQHQHHYAGSDATTDVPATPDYDQLQHHGNMYGFGAKYPATLPPYQQQMQQHQHYTHAKFTPTAYGFAAPPTPVPQYGSDPTTPVTPQAALDMAHHMMFYSQLLATPTLISPLLSPMMSPMILGYDPHQHHYQQLHYNQHFSPYKPSQAQVQQPCESPRPTMYNTQVTTSAPPPMPPNVLSAAKVPSSGTPFRIGGATFVLEEPQSPTGLSI